MFRYSHHMRRKDIIALWEYLKKGGITEQMKLLSDIESFFLGENKH